MLRVYCFLRNERRGEAKVEKDSQLWILHPQNVIFMAMLAHLYTFKRKVFFSPFNPEKSSIKLHPAHEVLGMGNGERVLSQKTQFAHGFVQPFLE